MPNNAIVDFFRGCTLSPTAANEVATHYLQVTDDAIGAAQLRECSFGYHEPEKETDA
jgi:hypothetical protein